MTASDRDQGSASDRDSVTEILARGEGRSTLDELMPVVYGELRTIARRQLAGDWRQQTLDTTALVNEAYVSLVDEDRLPLKCRSYFFAAAAQCMRRILAHAARRRGRLKRGGDLQRAELDDALDDPTVEIDGFATEVLDLDRSLEKLEREYPRQARVLECRVFAGLSVEETAAALDLSARTVKRDWALAKAWLHRDLEGGSAAVSGP